MDDHRSLDNISDTLSTFSFGSNSTTDSINLITHAQLPRPTWIPDSEVSACHLCNQKFSLVTRKHHCRACGNVICAKCSKNKKALTQLGYLEEQRVCDCCYTIKNISWIHPKREKEEEEKIFKRTKTIKFYPPLSNTKHLLNIKQQHLQSQQHSNKLHYFNVNLLESHWGNCMEISCSIDNLGVHWHIKNQITHCKFVDILAVKKSKGNKVFSSIHWFPWTIKGDTKKREERSIAIMHMSSADKLKFYTIVSHAISNISPYPFPSLLSSTYFLSPSVTPSASSSSSPAKPFLVLINSSAGNKQAKAIYDSIAHLFKYASIHVTTCELYEAIDAKEVVIEQPITKFSRIICCGGDGVPLQVFSALMKRPDNEITIKIPVSMIPAGNGVGYSASILGCADPLTAAYTISKQFSRPLDLIEVKQKGKVIYHSGLFISWGTFADCDNNSNFKWFGNSRYTIQSLVSVVSNHTIRGKVSYLPAENQTMSFCTGEFCSHCIESVRTHTTNLHNSNESLGSNDSPVQPGSNPNTPIHRSTENLPELEGNLGMNEDLQCEPSDTKHDNEITAEWVEESGEFMMVTGCNMSDITQGIRIAPYAHPSDGCIDLVILRKAPMSELSKILFSLKNGTYVNNPNFNSSGYFIYVKVKAFRIESHDDNSYYSVDGTKVKSKSPISCRVLPAKAVIG